SISFTNLFYLDAHLYFDGRVRTRCKDREDFSWLACCILRFFKHHGGPVTSLVSFP
ncbi:hypothetical protein HGM15179_001731, partial [Zosterops borbonicus]